MRARDKSEWGEGRHGRAQRGRRVLDVKMFNLGGARKGSYYSLHAGDSAAGATSADSADGGAITDGDGTNAAGAAGGNGGTSSPILLKPVLQNKTSPFVGVVVHPDAN